MQHQHSTHLDALAPVTWKGNCRALLCAHSALQGLLLLWLLRLQCTAATDAAVAAGAADGVILYMLPLLLATAAALLKPLPCLQVCLMWVLLLELLPCFMWLLVQAVCWPWYGVVGHRNTRLERRVFDRRVQGCRRHPNRLEACCTLVDLQVQIACTAQPLAAGASTQH